jgi:hypothetical protein
MRGTGDELIRAVIRTARRGLRDVTQDVNHTVRDANDTIDANDDMREGGAR